MGAGCYVSNKTGQKVSDYGFAYDSLNSEVRLVIPILNSLGMLKESAWYNLIYFWQARYG